MDKESKKWPKLSGEMSFRAAKDKCLPVFAEAKKLVRISDKKAVTIKIEDMPYSAKNSLCKAVMDGDIEVVKAAAKGGK